MTWKDVHAHLSLLARKKGAIHAEEATWLVRAQREKVHIHLGYGSLIEYLGRIFGYGPRLAHDKVRVAEALDALPQTRQMLATGELSWSSVRELSRVATMATEARWIEAAAGKTVREVERLVSGKRPGDTPDAPAEPTALRTILRLEISADTLAAFREARERCTREVGHRLDDDELVRMIVEKALTPANDDERRSPYQVKITVCSECGAGLRVAAGELHRMEQARVDQALCDAQLLGADPKSPIRATHTIPPAIRRSVLRRDDGCVVPGCRNSAFRELHHVIPRSRGGTHDPDRLAPLCSAHHAAVHRGAIRIKGTHSDGFRIEHADGRRYGSQPLAPAPTRAGAGDSRSGAARSRAGAPLHVEHRTSRDDVRSGALSLLRKLGFDEREAWRTLALARGESMEDLLHEALRTLVPRRSTEPGRRSPERSRTNEPFRT